jgi:hypothetical protein
MKINEIGNKAQNRAVLRTRGRCALFFGRMEVFCASYRSGGERKRLRRLEGASRAVQGYIRDKCAAKGKSEFLTGRHPQGAHRK